MDSRTKEEEADHSPVEAAERVAPGWRTASLVFGSLVALLTALGPVSAWINGVHDRALQKQQAQDKISLRYMDLLLRGYETPEERKVTLTFLRDALSTERPSDLMLSVVERQLTELDQVSDLQARIAVSNEAQQSILEQLNQSEQETSALRLRLTSMESSARVRAEEITGLQDKLQTSEQSRLAQQEALEAERQVAKDLRARLTEAQAAAGATGKPKTTMPTAPSPRQCCIACGGTLVCGSTVVSECGSCGV